MSGSARVRCAAGAPFSDVVAAAEDDRIRDLLRALALEDDPETADPEVAPAVVEGRIRRLLVDRIEATTDALREELRQLNHTTDGDRVLELQRELARLQHRRRALLGQPA